MTLDSLAPFCLTVTPIYISLPSVWCSPVVGANFCCFLRLLSVKVLTLNEINAFFSQPQRECGVVSHIRMNIERRQHKRFQVPPRIFVGVGPHFTKVGRLRNLSTDGLSFRYVGSRKPSSGSYVDMFTLEGDLFFTSLPIKIVSDIEVGEKAPPSAITTRRCSVKFGELTAYQSGRLKYFIKKYAIDEE